MLNFQPILMMCFVVSYPNLTFLSYSFSNKQDTTQNRLWNWTTCSQEFISWAEQQGHRQTFTWHLWLVEWAQLLKITKKKSHLKHFYTKNPDQFECENSNICEKISNLYKRKKRDIFGVFYTLWCVLQGASCQAFQVKDYPRFKRRT